MGLRLIVGGLCLGALGHQAAAQTVERRLNFISCPIVRDTSTVPCWLADYEGKRYYLTIQTDISGRVHPPYLGHKVLVEGRMSDKEICGGQVLEDISISPLPELSPECNQMLPREERYDLPFAPPRPPGPSGGNLAFGDLPGPPPETGRPRTGSREFDIPFGFDAVLGSTHAQHLIPPFDYALEIGARRVEITGFRGAALLDGGIVYRERESIATERAQQVAASLKGAGLGKLDVRVLTADAPPPNGIDDADQRRVRVRIIP